MHERKFDTIKMKLIAIKRNKEDIKRERVEMSKKLLAVKSE